MGFNSFPCSDVSKSQGAIMFTTSLLILSLNAAPAPAAGSEAAKGKEVPYTVHNGYFEKNSSGLKGNESRLFFNSEPRFYEVFGEAAVQGRKQNFLPRDAFEKKVVVAV